MTIQTPPRSRIHLAASVVVVAVALVGFIGQPAVTVEIHLGGLTAGFLLGLLLSRIRNRSSIVATCVFVVGALAVVVGLRASVV